MTFTLRPCAAAFLRRGSLALAGLVLVLPALAAAFPYQGYGIGFAGPNGLLLPSHARALGMGEAYVAAANDLGSMDYNPAGLSAIYAGMLKLQHREWYQDVRTDHLSFAGFAGPVYFGGGFAYTYVEGDGVAEIIDNTGMILGKFTPYAMSGNLAVAYGWRNMLRIGGQMKYFEEVFNLRYDEAALDAYPLILPEHDRLKSRATLFDLGFQGGYPKIGLQFGYAYQNFGSRWAGQIAPEVQRLGLSYRPVAILFTENPMTLSYEIRFPIDRYPISSFGFEWVFARALAVRWGYHWPMYENILAEGRALDLDRWRFGLGVGDDYFKIDYAFKSDEALGQAHLASISFGFGSSKPRPTPVRTEEPTPAPTLPPVVTPTPTPEPTAVVTETPEAVATPGIIPPGTRPVITRALAGNGRVSLEWSPPYDGKILGFFVNVLSPDGRSFRKPSGGQPKKGNRLALGLANNKTYVLSVVVAHDATHEGPPSEPVTLTPFNILADDEEVLFADLSPSGLSGEIRGEKMILTWKNAIDERVGGTWLELKQGEAGEYKRKGFIHAGASMVSLKVKGGAAFPPGKYYYRVVHTNGLTGTKEKLSKPSRAIILTKKLKEGAAAEPQPAVAAEAQPQE